MSERGSIGPAGGLDLVDEGERGTKDNSHHEWMGWVGRKTKSLDALCLINLLDTQLQLSCKQLNTPGSICRKRSQ